MEQPPDDEQDTEYDIFWNDTDVCGGLDGIVIRDQLSLSANVLPD